MRHMKTIGDLLVTAFALSSLATAAHAQSTAEPKGTGGKALLSAAASTKDVMESLAEQFAKKSKHAIKVNPGSSNSLAGQIISGAPADLFLSANQEWADKVNDAKLASQQVKLLTNKLVLIVPKGNPAGIKEPKDLAKAAVKKIALAGEKVPAGKYADQALTKLGLLDGLVKAKKIVRAQDVRAALAYVERGEVEAGIVYSTDLVGAKNVEQFGEFDPKLHDEIVYGLVLLKRGEDNPAAKGFFEFLKSDEANETYKKFGFERLRDAPPKSQGAVILAPEEWQAVRLTLQVAAAAVLSGLPFAILIGWVLAKRNFPGKFLAETLVSLPLVMPPVVTGYLLLMVFGRRGLLGGLLEDSLGLRFVFDWKGAALAAAVVGFPLLVRPIRQAFEAIDDQLIGAARSLGASPLDAFWSVTLPLARPGILSGCVLAFARSMGEFGATIMIAGNIPGETRTLTLHIYSLLENPDGLAASYRLVLVSIVIAALALGASEYLARFGHRRLRGAGIQA